MTRVQTTLLAAAVVVGAAAAAGAQTNLALNKTATGSMPCNVNEGPAKAFNGSVAGGNTDKWCSFQPTKFLQVDLGARVRIGRFVVRHAAAGGESPGFNTRDFEIQVSDDGTSNFRTVVTVAGNTSAITTHDIAGQEARFVRLNVAAPEQGGGGAARIYELEVFEGTAPPRTNVALGKPATGSTPCNGNEGPGQAVNGSVSGGNSDKFCSLTAPRFLQIDLGGTFDIDQFVVRHAGAGGESATFNTRDFTIQVGATPDSIATAVTVTGNTQNVTTHSITPRRGRHVRLNVTAPTQTGNAAMRIYELEVFGTPAGGGGGCDGLPAPEPTWQEHWFDHNLEISLVASDCHTAIYFDDDVPREHAAFWRNFISTMWAYFKQTYGSFGPDPRLYSIHHQGRYFGGHPDVYLGGDHDFRNVSDAGASDWSGATGERDVVSHETCHVIEFAAYGLHASPGFLHWGDSKWAEICQYDLYLRTGQQADADRVFAQFMNSVDNFPRPGTRWFRDWFYPNWRDHGGAQVMNRFFQLLAQHFPTHLEDHGRGSHLHHNRDMTFGEFVHFMSGAANANLFSRAQTAFGGGWEAQFERARADFPQITY